MGSSADVIFERRATRIFNVMDVKLLLRFVGYWGGFADRGTNGEGRMSAYRNSKLPSHSHRSCPINEILYVFVVQFP